MEDAELARLPVNLESDRVEVTEAFRNKDKIGEAVCAFANDLANDRRPGVLFVRAKDDGSCANLIVSDELLRNLAAFRSDGNIYPLPVITVEKRRIQGCEMAVVTVEPSELPPVRLTEKRRARDLPFDARPLPSASVDDLDLNWLTNTYLPSAVAPEVVSENRRTLLDQLASLRLVTGAREPTVLGMLVGAKDCGSSCLERIFSSCVLVDRSCERREGSPRGRGSSRTNAFAR